MLVLLFVMVCYFDDFAVLCCDAWVICCIVCVVLRVVCWCGLVLTGVYLGFLLVGFTGYHSGYLFWVRAC